ncbi:MAG: response regulator [Candidatus Hydrogenedentota bacterium]|nr:MAG: response regulator [Candidatus Hydrogenedentota bacterium]
MVTEKNGDSARKDEAARTLLVVEDQPIIRRSILRALRDGWRISEAGSLADARKTLKELTPDIVLLDLRLPDGDGEELIDEIRSRDWSVMPAIIVISGRPGDVGTEVLRKGAAGYLSKPFTASELRSTLEEALRP